MKTTMKTDHEHSDLLGQPPPPPKYCYIEFPDTHMDRVPLIIDPVWFLYFTFLSSVYLPVLLEFDFQSTLSQIKNQTHDKVRSWSELLKHFEKKNENFKSPEFIIHPFGDIKNCPKNILTQFKKQLYRVASDGNGWIVHDGLSKMAGLLSDAMKLYKGGFS